MHALTQKLRNRVSYSAAQFFSVFFSQSFMLHSFFSCSLMHARAGFALKLVLLAQFLQVSYSANSARGSLSTSGGVGHRQVLIVLEDQC